MSASALVDQNEIGRIYSVRGQTIIDWYKDGKIPAAVAEGQIYRFDADKVAKALAERAKQVKPRPKKSREFLPLV